MTNSKQRRAVITGLGAVTPNGIGTHAFWHALSHGISGITSLPYDESGSLWAAGLVRNFIADEHIDRKLAHRTDRMTHFALAAIQEALYDAGLVIEEEDPSRVGAMIANTLGGVGFVFKQLQALYIRGPRFVSAYTAIAWLNIANVGQAAIRYGLQGYSKTPINDAASGLNALGMAYRAIRRGSADIIFAGGCEAFLHPIILQVMERQGTCFKGDDPRAYRPFDRRARGLILAEGAGICIVEEYEHALRRGAPIYGEIIGYGQTQDIHGHGLTPPTADGSQYARAISLALQEAAVQPETISCIFADGRALKAADEGEANALQAVWGTGVARIPITVPRTMLGHSYAAAGAIDTIAALLALKHGLLPPTMNCEELLPSYQFDLVRDKARPLPPQYEMPGNSRTALIGSRSMGGANVTLALKTD